MLIRKAFKFKLKTNPDIEHTLRQFEGANRFVWNKALGLNVARLERHEKKNRRIIGYNDFAGLLRLWKQSEEMSFLKDVQSQTLQQTLKDLEKATRDAFNPRQPLKQFPVFKRKHDSNGFRFPQGIKMLGNRIYLPKIGWVRYFNSRKVEGDIKNVTVSRSGKNWFASIQVELQINEYTEKPKKAIGVDLGISKNAALSDGSFLEGSRSFKNYKKKLAIAQKKMSKKVRFSANWKKAKSKIQRIHEKISNTRKDRIHWMTTFLSRQFTEIYIEDLKIKNMSKSASGTKESPGRMVAQKKGLNREILDQGWFEFKRQLTYKQDWSGGLLQSVNAAYTSQKCSNRQCGYTAKKNRENQSVFRCKMCGHSENADTNAAKNILAAGLAVFACGEDALATSVKQEPLAVR